MSFSKTLIARLEFRLNRVTEIHDPLFQMRRQRLPEIVGRVDCQVTGYAEPHKRIDVASVAHESRCSRLGERQNALA